MNWKERIFGRSDYLVLTICVLLAFAVWFIHNMSLRYSTIVQCSVSVQCPIDGHDNHSAAPAEITARCDMNGFAILSYRLRPGKHAKTINVSPESLHYVTDDIFGMTKSDLTRYFNSIYDDNAKLEYFITDTAFYRFPKVNYKKVPVNVVSDLSYKSQYMPVGVLKVVPDSVYVYGQDNILNGIDRVNTELIKLEGLSSESYGEARLEQIKETRLSQESIHYSISVTRYVEREIVVPVRSSNVPAGYDFQVYPSTAKLRVRTFFPSNEDLSSAYVNIDYESFAGSLSGRCEGVPSNIPSTVLSVEVEPEFFDCIVRIP